MIVNKEEQDAKYTLRDVQDGDHEWLVDLHNDEDVLRNMTDPRSITLEDHMRWWKSIDGKNQIRMIFCVNSERVGFCKFYSIDYQNFNCMLGADIHKDYRGNRYSKPMWELVLDHCYNNLGLKRVSLTTAEYNKIAQRVYQQLGFIVEGRQISSLFRDNKWFDQICMYHLIDWTRNNI
jgi:RimJ/RimL family protein N-acetyltransferase